MKEFTVGPEAEDKRLDRYLSATFGRISIAQAQKIIRQEQARLNGKHPALTARVHAGDQLRLYVPDEWLLPPEKKRDPFYGAFRWRLDALYEDESLLLVDKRPGLICHADESEKVDTLVNHARAYLYQKGEWAAEKGAFAPSLCNRIDRFTGGIVLVAKTEDALRATDRAIREREIRKFYLCVAHGHFSRDAGLLDGYLSKAPGGKKMLVSRRALPGAQRAQTGFRVLTEQNGLSLVECELFTGRTHQIRAQMADAGHPLLGDGQYGRSNDGRPYQALYAYRLFFDLKPDAANGPLAALRGRSVQASHVPFVRQYFPDYRLYAGEDDA